MNGSQNFYEFVIAKESQFAFHLKAGISSSVVMMSRVVHTLGSFRVRAHNSPSPPLPLYAGCNIGTIRPIPRRISHGLSHGGHLENNPQSQHSFRIHTRRDDDEEITFEEHV